MRFARVTMAAAMLAGLGPAGAPAQEGGETRDCSASRSGDFGSIWVTSLVAAADGRVIYYQASWNWRPLAPGVGLSLRWEGPALAPPPDSTRALIRFSTGRRGTRMARIELDRAPGGSSDGQLALTTPFQNQSGDLYAWLSWGELRRHMQSVPALFATAIEQRRGAVGHGRIEAATLDAPGAAIDAVREDLAAMERDFRNRCPIHDVPDEDI